MKSCSDVTYDSVHKIKCRISYYFDEIDDKILYEYHCTEHEYALQNYCHIQKWPIHMRSSCCLFPH